MPDPTLLAVPLTRSVPPLAEQARAAQQSGAKLVELRVDCIDDAEAVAEFLERANPIPFIVTIRSAAEGGRWDGDDAERIALYERLGLLRPGYVDVEYATWTRSANLRQKIGLVCPSVGDATRPGNLLILSHHDFHGTPPNLDDVIRPLLDSPADIIKVVFTARDATDAWRVLALLNQYSQDRRLIALAMGEAGLLTRVLSAKFGGFLTFAAPERGAESAPGQPTVHNLLEVYRWRDIGPRTRVFGVIGWPVGQSRSPLVHNAAMSAADVDGVYVPMPVAPTYADFAALLDLLTIRPEFDVAGLSVTIPHKQHALRWLDERGFTVADLARKAGAVNTITRTGPASWIGDNTDTMGVLAVLGPKVDGRRVAVLGAGGAARAAIVALLSCGCQVTIFNRTEERATTLASELCCRWQPWQDRIHHNAEVVVNCTSIGMQPDVNASPLPPESLQPGMLVFDTVYNPPMTCLLNDAQQRGCNIISGVEMFLAQAAGQFEKWHDQPAPINTMRVALLDNNKD